MDVLTTPTLSKHFGMNLGKLFDCICPLSLQFSRGDDAGDILKDMKHKIRKLLRGGKELTEVFMNPHHNPVDTIESYFIE